MTHLIRGTRGLEQVSEIMCAMISAEFTRQAQQQKAAKATSAEGNTVKAVDTAPARSAPQNQHVPLDLIL